MNPLGTKSHLPNPTVGTSPNGTNPIWGIDTEYLSKGTSPIEVLTVGLGTPDTVYTWDRDMGGIDPAAYTHDTQVLVGQNIPEDLALLWEKGWIPKREDWLRGHNVYDSLLIAKMVDETLSSYKLEDLLAHYFDIEPWKFKTKSKDVTKWTPEERVERCGKDAWAPVHLVKTLFPRLDGNSQRSLYPFTMGVAMTLHRMTLAGAVVDRTKFHTLTAQVEQRRKEAHDVLLQAAGFVDINDYEPSNDNQTRDILFSHCQLSPITYTPKTHEPQITKEVLENLAENTSGGIQVFLQTLLEFNHWDKILSTYLVGGKNAKAKKQNAIARLGIPIGQELISYWLPFRFNSLGAKTARRSSSSPNSQNWSKLIRGLVRSRWTGGSILAADYRKLEPVIIAWLSDDEQLLDYFTTGEGYRGLARDLLRTEVAEGTPLYRGVKSIVLGVHYDMRTNEMARQLWYNHKIRFDVNYRAHWQETDRIRNLYLNAHPKLGEYMERRRREALTTGLVRTPTGRLRHVGTGANKHTLNQAINAPVQSTASDITGAALIGVESAVLQEYHVTLTEWFDYLLAQRKLLTSESNRGIIPFEMRIPTLFNEVHDELTIDLPPENQARNVELVVETMRAVPLVRELAPYLKDMPLFVDPKIGSYWGQEG